MHRDALFARQAAQPQPRPEVSVSSLIVQQVFGQGIEFGFESQDIETLDRAGGVNGSGDGFRTSFQLLPGWGEAQQGAAFVAGVAGLSQQAVVNQAFDERGEGSAVEIKSGATATSAPLTALLRPISPFPLRWAAPARV